MRDHWTVEDRQRLRPHNARVLEFVKDAGWFTLEYVAFSLGLRNGSTVSSRLRDIKAESQWTYERRRSDTPGVFEYRLVEKNPRNAEQLSLLEVNG